MILNTIPDHRLIRRTIYMGEHAFLNKHTLELFIPLVEDVWYNEKTRKQIRVLANNQHRYNVKLPYFRNNFEKIKVLTWDLIFACDPKTMKLDVNKLPTY